MKKKAYDFRYLLAAIILFIVLFAASLLLWPEWRQDTRTLVALGVAALVGAFGFLDLVKSLIAKEKEAPPSSPLENNTGGGATIQGDVEIAGDFVARDKVVQQEGPVNIGGDNYAPITVTTAPQVEAGAAALRESYLHQVLTTCGQLSLTGIDRKAASESQTNIALSAVYTALLTQSHEEEGEQPGKRSRAQPPERESRRLSVLEMLNRRDRLVLLGDPGSGKSTFVSFAALCMAGELLGQEEANLALLRTPLPEDETRSSQKKEEEPQPQPWKHGALLPVKIVLRDLAARGLPEPGKRAGVENLWRFLSQELETAGLGSFAAHLRKTLLEQGGLVMFDGLDEVPEAEQRRAQIKQIVEGFAGAFPRCRVLVTSRTYAYQKQEWRLAGFAETTLAPFSAAQISQFIERWYAHIAAIRNLNAEDARGRAELLRRAALGSERMRGLAERPLLLTLMASLHAWRGGSLPEKREELYSDAVELLLDWWEAQRVVRGPKGEIVLAQPSLVEWLKIRDRQQVRDLLNRLAYEAHLRQPDLSGTADVPEGDLAAGLLQLSEREDINPRELRDYLSQRAGLLLPRGVGVYTFPHRTFQEYLAACHLTDHDFPDIVAGLACRDYERWREVALLSGAKAARGTASAVWSLVDALCYTDAAEGPCGETGKLWGAHLAGQALVESAGLAQVSERNRPKLERVRGWLVHVLRQGELPARERALAGDSLSRLGDPRFDPGLFYLPDENLLGFREVPAGPFSMGSDPKKDRQAYDDEQPQHTVNLPAFYIARYPVTVAQFRAFVDASGYDKHDPRCLRGLPNHPVVWVTWHDALAYCRWLEKALREGAQTPPALRALLESGLRVTLPSEAEWEKAARGADGRVYPWVGSFDPDKANTGETGIGGTSAAGCFPGGESPCGALDMSGNVWEWTRSLWGKELSEPDFKYPYDPSDRQRENLRAGNNVYRVLRGGSWYDVRNVARCAFRDGGDPDFFNLDVGFRLACSPSTSGL